MSGARQRCPQCGAVRVNAFRLNHVHDGVVVPFEHFDGPAIIELSSRFGEPAAAPEPPAPVKRGPGRPRKNAVT